MLSDYINQLREVKEEDIKAIVGLITQNEDKRIFTMGNGGSASTANHFASDLQNIGLEAISLCSNTAILTRLANDESYNHIFLNQLKENHLKLNEIVIAISASGNSFNILNAVAYVNEIGAIPIGLTGFGGGRLIQLIDSYINLSSRNYGVIEGVHCCLIHLITELLCPKLKQ